MTKDRSSVSERQVSPRRHADGFSSDESAMLDDEAPRLVSDAVGVRGELGSIVEEGAIVTLLATLELTS